jgi:hypothetical protein
MVDEIMRAMDDGVIPGGPYDGPDSGPDSALDMLRERMDELQDQRHVEARRADAARQRELRARALVLDALTLLRGCRDSHKVEWDALMAGPMGPSIVTVWDKLKEVNK